MALGTVEDDVNLPLIPRAGTGGGLANDDVDEGMASVGTTDDDDANIDEEEEEVVEVAGEEDADDGVEPDSASRR